MTQSLNTPPTARRPFRRWLQFRLRSVLILVSFVAVGLGFWQHLVEPFRIQRAAALAIAEAGGTCRTAAVGPPWLRHLAIGHDFEEIITVDLPKPEMTSSCVSLLGRLRSLEELSVAGAAFSDEHLAKLRSLRNLRKATLRGTTVTEEGVEQLRNARPELALVVEPLEISFREDLRFDDSSVSPLPGQPFDPSRLPARIRGLVGSAVRIRGVVAGNSPQPRLSQFLLVDDVVR
jgi:hypothetical protein